MYVFVADPAQGEAFAIFQQKNERSVIFYMDLGMISGLGKFAVARQDAGGEIRRGRHGRP